MTDTGTWAGARLAAFRDAKGLTQQAVASKTGIDRSVIVALENGRRTISPYYASKIAPIVGVKAGELLPPAEDGHRGPVDPYVLLAELSATVDEMLATQEELQGRVEKLERAARRRGRGAA